MAGKLTGDLRRVAGKLKVEFYRSTNPDLAHMTDQELREHWQTHGSKEGRLGQPDGHDFDPDFYLAYYPDLVPAGIVTAEDARHHWLRYGRAEERFASLDDWASNVGPEILIDVSTLDVDTILSQNKSISAKMSDVCDLCVGEVTKPLKLFEDPKRTAQLYIDIGRQLLGKREGLLARNAFEAALLFETSPAALAGVGQSWLVEPERAHRRKALGYFEAAAEMDRGSAKDPVDYVVAEHLDVDSPQVVDGIITCYLDIEQPRSALALIRKRMAAAPSATWLYYSADRVAKAYYNQLDATLKVQAALGERDEMIELADTYADEVYRSYFDFLTTFETPGDAWNQHGPTQKVLIIGDFSVPQCERYRVNQKVEQLNSQGIAVTVQDWNDLNDDLRAVSFHDTVIFYRVPAAPLVLKAMAISNAAGNKTFYEIDDLLFEKVYPPPIESYGGNVPPSFYHNLTTGMALMQAAAKRCPFAIASTAPLAALLAEHVTTKKCLVHRNGLDSLSQFDVADKSQKEHVDIIYASGTLAHNEDFFEQAYGPLKDILRKHRHVRLVIAGYLELSNDFVREFGDQLIRLPFVANVQAYWQYLKSADINLAVLNDDLINGAKSELKWVEAACFKIPSILSLTENYDDVIADGEDAYLVSTPDEWGDVLEALVTNPELRSTIGTAAHDRIVKDYSVSALGKKLVADMNSVAPRPDGPSKKKIALVNVFFPPQSIGGATRVLSDNFDEIQEKYGDDFELVVFTSDTHCTDPHLLHTYHYKGVKVYRSTIDYRENMDWEASDDEMYRLFAEFLRVEKPDLVHFHAVQRLTASIVHATKDAQIPYIVTAHDAWWISDFQFLTDKFGTVYPMGHPDPYAPRTLRDSVTLTESLDRLTYLRSLLDGAAQVLTVSESFAEIYKANGFPQIQVNKNGVSSNVDWAPKDTSDHERVICGHVGNAARHKGFHLLRDAVLEAQPEHLEFLVVDYAMTPGSTRHVKWGSVPVTFIAPVPQTEIASLYQQIDVLFAPSLWPESFGLVTREAAASKCWVVASDRGAMGEDVEDGVTGFRVSPELGAMVEVIEKIDSEPMKYKGLSPTASPRLSDDQATELVEIWDQSITNS